MDTSGTCFCIDRAGSYLELVGGGMDMRGTCFGIDTFMFMFMMSGTCFCTNGDVPQNNWIYDERVPMI